MTIHKFLHDTTIDCNIYGKIKKIECSNKRKEAYDFMDRQLQGPLPICYSCIQDWYEDKGDRIYKCKRDIVDHLKVISKGTRHCDRCFTIVLESEYNIRMHKCNNCLKENIDRRKVVNK